jgi:hypothetical protein
MQSVFVGYSADREKRCLLSRPKEEIMETMDHWQEWRKAVEKTGFTPTLKLASERMFFLFRKTPEQVEEELQRAAKELGRAV